MLGCWQIRPLTLSGPGCQLTLPRTAPGGTVVLRFRVTSRAFPPLRLARTLAVFIVVPWHWQCISSQVQRLCKQARLGRRRPRGDTCRRGGDRCLYQSRSRATTGTPPANRARRSLNIQASSIGPPTASVTAVHCGRRSSGCGPAVTVATVTSVTVTVSVVSLSLSGRDLPVSLSLSSVRRGLRTRTQRGQWCRP